MGRFVCWEQACSGRPSSVRRRFYSEPAQSQKAVGIIKYAFSNLPADTSRLQVVRLWRERWKIKQGYQQMKEELGLDHFEGPSWRGFHQHAALGMLAFGFLALEQRRAKQRPPKKSRPLRPA